MEFANTGALPVRVGVVEVGGLNPGDFEKSVDSCTQTVVAQQSKCQVTVRFSPTAEGPRRATLTFKSSDDKSPHVVTLEGSGYAVPRITTDHAELDFGSPQRIPGIPALTVTLRSSGTAPLEVSRLDVEGAQAGDFRIASSNCTGAVLPPPSNCAVEVRFTPDRQGHRDANLVIWANAGQISLPVKGTLRYLGPPEGVIVWSGNLKQNGLLTIEGSQASSGSMRGSLPGVPVIIDLDTDQFAVADPPGPDNSWNRLAIRSKKERASVVTVKWTVLP